MRFLVLLFALLTAGTIGRSELSMSTLQSLPAVGVEVAALPASADAFALVETDLVEYVRRILEGEKVPLVGEERLDREPGRPILRVSLKLGKVRGKSYLYVIDLDLSEMVVPVRPLESLEDLPAVTWHRQSAGIANRGQTVLDALERMVVDFGTEYQREN